MNDSLLNGDKLIVSELFSKPQCGDIIIANEKDVVGKAEFIVYPFNRITYLY